MTGGSWKGGAGGNSHNTYQPRLHDEPLSNHVTNSHLLGAKRLTKLLYKQPRSHDESSSGHVTDCEEAGGLF